MINVVAALIWDNKHFLICQRPVYKAQGLLWEFVGGKVEDGESMEQALIRECYEELGVTVSVDKKYINIVHKYPDFTISLTLFHTTIANGIPKCLEHNDLRWIVIEEASQYEFCPADQEIIKKISEDFS